MAAKWDKLDRIDFSHTGIGSVLSQQRLSIPLNQREYSWEKENAATLFDDLADAITKGPYFLGTIVLTQGDGPLLEVADGQQRLATCMIFLAAIRDYFKRIGQDRRADSIQYDYLFRTEMRSESPEPRFVLNVDDRGFFESRVLSSYDSPERNTEPTRASHRRISAAAEAAREKVNQIVRFYPNNSSEQLMDWVDYLKEAAQIVILTVPTYLDAFKMFETLNDRGVEASKADLLKSHILRLSEDSNTEAQQKWARMIGALDAIGRKNIEVTYLRHLMITLKGPTKEKDLMVKVKDHVNSKANALEFVDSLAVKATDYAALFNPSHVKWNEYGTGTRRDLATIIELDIEQIRPLLFAVAYSFSTSEARKAFRLFVAWSVRFMIAGGRGGFLDTHYSERAHAVGKGEIKTAQDLVTAMKDAVPTDEEFQKSFEDAKVSRTHLARYYLRTIERVRVNLPQQEKLANDDENDINLEHLLPENPSKDAWPSINPETASAIYRRIGNMVLMQARTNSMIGNSSFAEKRPHLEKSSFLLSRDVAAKYSEWNEANIVARQKDLARLAVQAWPISVPS